MHLIFFISWLGHRRSNLRQNHWILSRLYFCLEPRTMIINLSYMDITIDCKYIF
jgi:hypothetical protein